MVNLHQGNFEIGGLSGLVNFYIGSTGTTFLNYTIGPTAGNTLVLESQIFSGGAGGNGASIIGSGGSNGYYCLWSGGPGFSGEEELYAGGGGGSSIWGPGGGNFARGGLVQNAIYAGAGGAGAPLSSAAFIGGNGGPARLTVTIYTNNN